MMGWIFRTIYKATRFLPVSGERRYALSRALTEAAYYKDIKAAQKDGKWGRADDLNHELRTEIQSIDEDRDIAVTRTLTREARRLSVAIPDGKEHWLSSDFSSTRFLSPAGIETLRASIRKEKSARHAMWSYLLSWFTAGTALVGAIAAIVAAVK